MIYLWCLLFFILGVLVGFKLTTAVITSLVKQGKMFFKHKNGMWHGEWDIIIRELNEALLKNNPHAKK